MDAQMTNGAISPERIRKLAKKLRRQAAYRLAMNAVTRGNLQDIAINRDVLNQIDWTFSHEVEAPGPITDQKRAGTCWLFADLNWLRTFTKKKIKVKEFEFSENWVMFWDKLEKANYFLEKYIELRHLPRDDRKVHHLLSNVLSDGGEWHMLVNVAKKYGLVPKSAMVDTWNREHSRWLNDRIVYKLREGAALIYRMHREGKDLERIREAKEHIMEQVFRILSTFMGLPPERFTWGYRDEDKKFHREVNITPQEFLEKYVDFDLDDVCCLMSCPAEDTPRGKTFTVELFNNMVGGRDWHWLNVPIDVLKRYAVKVLKNEEACLFGCDVIQESHSKEGILDTELFDYDHLFGTRFNMDKGSRVDWGVTRLTHSMVFVGVDLLRGRPVKWKVENSWGEEVGKKGYFVMTDRWFDEHVFNIMIHKRYLSEEHLRQYEQPPVVLPPWHPMA
jgi:bleomycin hydrolase